MEKFIPDLVSARNLIAQSQQNGTPAKRSAIRFISACDIISSTLSSQSITPSPISVFAATSRALMDAYPHTPDPTSELETSSDLRHTCGSLLRLLISVIPNVPSSILSSQAAHLHQPMRPLLTSVSASTTAHPMRCAVLCAAELIRAAPAPYSETLGPLVIAAALPRDPLTPRQQRVRDAAASALSDILSAPTFPGPHKAALGQLVAEQGVAALKVNAQAASGVALLSKTAAAVGGNAGRAVAASLALTGGRFASQGEEGDKAAVAVAAFEVLITLVQSAAATGNAGEMGAFVVEKLGAVWPYVQERAEILGAYCVALHQILVAVHRADRKAALELLPGVIKMLLPGLMLQSDDLVACVLQPMRAILRECIDTELLSLITSNINTNNNNLNESILAFGKVKEVLVEALNLRYEPDGLAHVFALFVTLARIVGNCAPKLIAQDLVRLCNLYELEDFDSRDALSAAVGAIIEAVGAPEFIACVPLNLTALITPPIPSSSSSSFTNEYLGIEEAEEGGDDGDSNVPAPTGANFNRHWILPILAKRMGRAPLELFVNEFYPAAKKLAEASEASAAEGYEVMAKNEWNRHMQLWELFPCCCRTAHTAAAAFPRIAKVLGTAVKDARYSRPICKGITALVAACKKAAAAPGSAEEAEEARAAIDALGRFSLRFLPCLFNTLSATPAAQRAPVMAAIGAYLSVTTAADGNNYFKAVVDQLLEATTVTSGGSNASDVAEKEAKAMSLMDLAVPFVAHLDAANMALLLRVVKPLLYADADTDAAGKGSNGNGNGSKALQKHAWKVVEAMCGRKFDAAMATTFSELLTARAPAAHAKKMWLRCVAALVRAEGAAAWAKESLVAAVLPAVILGVKDANSKTRSEAFATVVRLAEAYGDELEGLCMLVAAGLGGKNPHMIAATVVTLAQIFYKFADRLSDGFVDKLIETLSVLLLSEAPEIVKAVIQFYKTSLSVIPLPQFEKHLAGVLTNLVKWTKAHPTAARREARHLFERLLRKYGFPKIAELVPEDTRKVLNNIRKTKERRRKRREELLKSGKLAERKNRKKLAELAFEKTLDMSDLDTEEEEEMEEMEGASDNDDGYGYYEDGDNYGDEEEEEEEEEMLHDDYDDDNDDIDIDDDDDEDEEEEEGMLSGKKRKRGGMDEGYMMMAEGNEDEDDMMAMFDMRGSSLSSGGGSGKRGRGSRGDDEDDDMVDIDDRYMDMLAPRAGKRAAGDGAVARKRRKQNDGGRVEVNADGIIVVNEPEDEEGGVKIPKKRLQQLREERELFKGIPFEEGEDDDGDDGKKRRGGEEEVDDEEVSMSDKKRSKMQAAKGRSEMYQRMLERREKADAQKRNAKNAAAAASNAKYSGDMYKGTKGKGDIKKTGTSYEPFAYIPLNPKSLKQ